MTYNEQLSLAANLLKLPLEEAEKNCAIIEKTEALYVCNPVMGGASLIVGKDGSVLYANSSVGYDRQLQAFESGKRTPLDSFF